MKKEFVSLKENTNLLVDAVNSYKELRNKFELSFDALVVPGLEDYYDDECCTNFDIVHSFYELNPEVLESVTIIKQEHPRYGEPRFKATLVEAILDKKDISFDDATILADAHIAISKSGYFDVIKSIEDIHALEEKISGNGEEIFKKGKQACVKAGKSVITAVGNFARPYGEVARGQLNDASVKAKGYVNKGTKSLIKVLNKLDEKTK